MLKSWIRTAYGEALAIADWGWRDPVRAIAVGVPSPLVRRVLHGLLVARLGLGDANPASFWSRFSGRLEAVQDQCSDWELRSSGGERPAAVANPTALERIPGVRCGCTG